MTKKNQIENIQKLVNNVLENLFSPSNFSVYSFHCPRTFAEGAIRTLEEIDNQLGHLKNETLEKYLDKDV